jgi:hypothetical protein
MHRSRALHAVPGTRPGRLLAVFLVLGCLLIPLMAASSATAGPRSVIFDSAAEPSWVRYVAGSGAGEDAGYDVIVQGADATFMCGSLVTPTGDADMSVTRYAGDVPKWTRTFGGPAGGNDVAVRMALSPDGKAVYVTGMAAYASSPDLVLLKYSARTGKRLWVRHYDGPGHTPDVGWTIGVDREGNIVVGGYSQSGTDLDCTVASWTASGARRWAWRYAGSGGSSEMVHDMWVAPDGTTYACGLRGVATTRNGLVVRLSKAGRRLWLEEYEGPEGLGAAFTSIVPRPGGGVYVGGLSVAATTGLDGLLLRYSARGARTVFAVDKRGGGATDEMFRDIAVTTTKYVVGVGKTETGGSGDSHLVVYQPDGDVDVESTILGPSEDEWTCVTADAFGAFCVAGTFGAGMSDERIAVLRRSTLPEGGGFGSRWSPVVVADCKANAIATRGTSVYVAGSISAGGPSAVDQVLLAYTY